MALLLKIIIRITTIERYAAMNRIDEKKPIKNRFSYFLKMIKADAGME